MEKRDELKKKAIEIAANKSSQEASNYEKELWEEYRKIRNKINYAKRNDEAKYKKIKLIKIWTIFCGYGGLSRPSWIGRAKPNQQGQLFVYKGKTSRRYHE